MLGLQTRRILPIVLAIASPDRVFALGDRVRFLSCLGDDEPELVDIRLRTDTSGSLRHGRRIARGESSCDGFSGRSTEAVALSALLSGCGTADGARGEPGKGPNALLTGSAASVQIRGWSLRRRVAIVMVMWARAIQKGAGRWPMRGSTRS